MTAKIDPFRAIAVSEIAHRLKAEGRSVIHMEFGQPSTGAPAAAIAAAHRVLDSDPMGYWQSPGLKARIVQHYADWYGVKIKPTQVILTNGASPGLVMALNMSFNPGDRIAFARPGYVAYRNNLKALHMVPVEIECGAESRFPLLFHAIYGVAGTPGGFQDLPLGTDLVRAGPAGVVPECRWSGRHLRRPARGRAA